ncbi:MAG TPA: hypothetical protein VLJ39_06070 [Tepidisphaeraceae bacterium]|nr:hypothetical protein [Tepidisphaeraceae bacterium]
MGREFMCPRGGRVLLAAGLFLALIAGCDRQPEIEQPPLRKKLIGHWDSPTKTTSATLDLNEDGTFRYTFQKGTDATFTVKGNWILEDDNIVGLATSVENGNYCKPGDTFPLGKVTSVENDELKVRKKNGPEIYHRKPA